MEADRTVAIYSLPRLLGAAARHLSGQRAVLAQRADRPAERRRPAARRRRRRGADVAVGARAALHDRQHPLRGGPGDPAHDEPGDAARATRRCASRSAIARSRGCTRSAATRSRCSARTSGSRRRTRCPSRRPNGTPTPAYGEPRPRGASPRRLHSEDGRHRHHRRPVGRRGQGQDHRPARRERRPRHPLPGRQQRRPHDRPRRREVEVPPDPVGDPLSRASRARSATAS